MTAPENTTATSKTEQANAQPSDADPTQETGKEQEQPVEKLFTQEQVNSMVGNARTSEREKHANEISELKASNESAQKELEELRAANSALMSEKQHAEWRKQAAEEAGVPSALIRGDSLEEMQEHAAALHKALVTARMSNAPKYPVVNEGNSQQAATMGKSDILSIEDPKARKQAILENLDLF